VGKSLRFRVFMRDGFACRYCGRRAPNIELTIDHRLPVDAGGDNSFENLVSACRDCNAGKSTNLLPDQTVISRLEALEAWVRQHAGEALKETA
jgi:5-methylcytosine-specific restriction endonuclease McrA